MKILNIVVAAGSGTRFGADRPKQFCLLEGETVVSHAVRRLWAATGNAPTVVVVSPGYEDEVPDGCLVAHGGATRGESVRNALRAIEGMTADVILVHDGARPLPSRRSIDCAIEACRTHQGAIPVVPVIDSLRRASDGAPVNRADFRCVQTPQAFRADLLRQAYKLTEGEEFTDDASVMTAAGFGDIALTEGSPQNLKITLPLDLEIASIYLKRDDA
ncbi:MAG: 2-C-methyl-D-erythritol 4-phosphate cytidylyltransferase [Bacteroides sp.]|nr:2-C-methyl-D-erythritol 4-phosphate cytidylyltransferase [Bacteroides sp.]